MTRPEQPDSRAVVHVTIPRQVATDLTAGIMSMPDAAIDVVATLFEAYDLPQASAALADIRALRDKGLEALGGAK